jgi:hypothetical protein
MARIRRADAANVRASTPISEVGATTANRTPAPAGAAMSPMVAAAQMALFASAILERPTSTGTAPKFAASKNTNIVGATAATISTCPTESTPKEDATGSDPRATALSRSDTIISRWRFHRSASAPATSPNIR